MPGTVAGRGVKVLVSQSVKVVVAGGLFHGILWFLLFIKKKNLVRFHGVKGFMGFLCYCRPL